MVAELRDDRGQALLLAVLILAIGALAITGLQLGQQRILERHRDQRLGEATVEAATASIADAYTAALLEAQADERQPDVSRVLALPATREAARSAASEIATRNGGAFDGSIEATCRGDTVEVELFYRGRLYRAGFRANACSLP